MNEMEPTPSDETRPEDFVAPRTGEEVGEGVENNTRFVESAEMVALRAQIEQSSEFNPELWVAYYEAGLAIADRDGGSAIGKLEFQLTYAELKITAGYKDEAWEDLEQLSQTPEMFEFPYFGARVLAAIQRTN